MTTPERTWLESCLCSQAQLESETFAPWAELFRPAWAGGGVRGPILKRKFWEWIFLAQALSERGMLKPGKRGLGFGVGQEPHAAVFANLGCDILATDLEPSDPAATAWRSTAQHAGDASALNQAGLCDPAVFQERVRFRAVDMNHVPPDLRGFDFTWSSCAFEHLGSIVRGQDFVLNQMKCLKPGGVSVHTTEFNLSSNRRTLDYTGTVLFRQRDIEELAALLRAQGHQLQLSFELGALPADQHVDVPPYSGDMHLRLLIGEKYTVTSLGLVITRSMEEPPERLDARTAVGRSVRAAGRRLDALARETKSKIVTAHPALRLWR